MHRRFAQFWERTRPAAATTLHFFLLFLFLTARSSSLESFTGIAATR
jgi:hypothetical protein